MNSTIKFDKMCDFVSKIVEIKCIFKLYTRFELKFHQI